MQKDVKLTIVGNGSYKTKLEELTERTHTIQYIEFVGRNNKEQVRKYYQSADVFIIPSLSEGMPNVCSRSNGMWSPDCNDTL